MGMRVLVLAMVLAAGCHGDKGDAGAAGMNGANGANGVNGAAGPTGAIGPIGATGATGAMGVSGATGATGPMGPIGATGPAGSGASFAVVDGNGAALGALVSATPSAVYYRAADGSVVGRFASGAFAPYAGIGGIGYDQAGCTGNAFLQVPVLAGTLVRLDTSAAVYRAGALVTGASLSSFADNAGGCGATTAFWSNPQTLAPATVPAAVPGPLALQ
jgi:hypothetical protein